MATTVASQPYNVILAGAFAAGKTFIFNHLREESDIFPTRETSRNQRLDQWIHTATCGGDEIQVCLWDTGEMESRGTLQMTKSYFRSAVGVILVYDQGNLESLRKIEEWVGCVNEHSQWSKHVVFALWGNDKGIYGTNSSPVDDYHLGDFRHKVERLQDLPDGLCCVVNSQGSRLADSYQRLLDVLHSKLSNLTASMYQSFADNNPELDNDSTEGERSRCWC